MMKKMISILILMLGMMCLFVFVEASNRDEAIKAAPITIYVDDNFTDEPENHKWDTIQEGIDDANESDMVYVYSGTYHESIVINKTISLIGENRDKTVIDGVEGIRDVVRVEENWVNISGFTLKSRQHGIFLDSVSNNSITNSTLSDNEYGIYVQNSSKNKITNCNISNNSNYGIQFELSSNNNSIYHNNFIDNINLNHAYDSGSNYWDNRYPSGGNYWSGWIGIADSNHSENQDLPGSDGIYDGPFNIPGDINKDYYPLTHFLVWDEITPEIHLNFLENNSVIKPGTTIDFEIDDENLNIVRCSVNEEEYELSPSLWDIDTGDWDDGTYNIIIYANDYGRNERYESFTFTVDGVEPYISLISPENNSVIKPGTIIDFEINDIHLNLTTYRLDDTQPETLSSPYNISTKDWDDGLHNITVYANDFVGNEKTEKFTFIIDGASPYINIIGVANGSYYNTNVTPIIDISDAHLNEDGTIITLDDTFFISGVTVSAEGEHILYVYAVDKAGNNANKIIIFIIDKTPPTITIISPADGLITNQNVTLNYSFSDDVSSVENITVSGDGSPYSQEGNYSIILTATDQAGNNNISKIIIFTIDKTNPNIIITGVTDDIYSNVSVTPTFWCSDVNLDTVSAALNNETFTNGTAVQDEGGYTLFVKATDKAGNTANKTVTFTIDKTKPSITITGVTDGIYYNTEVVPVVDVTDTSSNTTISITLDGNIFINGTTITEENTYTFFVQAVDKAWNVNETTISFVVDKTKPALSDITPAIGTKTTHDNIVFSGKTEPDATVKINGINVSVSSDGFFSKKVTLVKGDNTITITATDRAGNTNTTTVTIERTEEKEEGLPDYLIYLITIPIVFVVALVVVIAFLKRKIKKRKIKIRCPACKTIFDEKPGKRPLKTKCPKCGIEGILR